MDWQNEFFKDGEQPLDRLVDGYSNTSIFRTMAFIGDSLSSGEFESRDKEGKPGWHDYYEYSWGQYIARKNGLTAYNFSRGGMTAKAYMDDFAKSQGMFDPSKAAQAYVIAMGVNDLMGMKQPVGSVEDIDDADYQNNKDTFAGCMGRLIAKYKEIQPRAKFFLVTMPRSNDENDALREEHAKLLYALAEHYENCFVIDLFKYAPIYDADFKKRFYLYGHMNAMGYIFTARIIDSYIDYIIRKNPEEFIYVPFIDTDLK